MAERKPSQKYLENQKKLSETIISAIRELVKRTSQNKEQTSLPRNTKKVIKATKEIKHIP